MSNINECNKKNIEEYKVQEKVDCYKILADNRSWATTKWQLIGSDGSLLYESGKYKLGQECIIDLNSLKTVPYGTVMFLKANVISGDDSQSDVFLVYNSTCNNTAYFELTGTAFNTTLVYKGTL